jgi:hypothetical protein
LIAERAKLRVKEDELKRQTDAMLRKDRISRRYPDLTGGLLIGAMVGDNFYKRIKAEEDKKIEAEFNKRDQELIAERAKLRVKERGWVRVR